MGKGVGRGLRDYLDVLLRFLKVRLDFPFFVFLGVFGFFLWDTLLLRDLGVWLREDALGVVEIFTNIWSNCSSSKTG